MRRIVAVLVLLAACGASHPKINGSSGELDRWLSVWCDLRPLMTKTELVGRMGSPSVGSTDQNLLWRSGHYGFTAALIDGKTVQLFVDTSTLNATERHKVRCSTARYAPTDAMGLAP